MSLLMLNTSGTLSAQDSLPLEPPAPLANTQIDATGPVFEAVEQQSDPVREPSKSTLTDSLSIALVAFGTAAAVMILLRNLRKHARKSREMDRPARDRLDDLRTQAANSGDLHSTMALAQDTVQRMVSQLETKAARAEALLDRAEARLIEYEAKLAHLEARGLTLTKDRDESASDAATTPHRSNTPTIDPLHRRVHELADQGLNPVDIARRVDRPTGQVELILALRRA